MARRPIAPVKPERPSVASARSSAPLVEVATLETLAALRAVADDQRSRILSVLIEAPLTAGELARRLGIARTRIYYNLDMLERHGIIRVVEERVVERRVERVYRAVARRYRVDADLLGRGRARPLARVRARIIEQVAIDMKELSRSPKADDPSVLVGRTRGQASAGSSCRVAPRAGGTIPALRGARPRWSTD